MAALHEVLLEADLALVFALVREAAKRALGQRHYDVQLIGGLALTEGKIAEMRTGEGKTLVATLPVTAAGVRRQRRQTSASIPVRFEGCFRKRLNWRPSIRA